MYKVGCNVDAVQPMGGTALHAAIRKRRVASIVSLLDAGADPLMEDAAGKTALKLVIEEGYYDEYSELIGRVRPEELPVEEDTGDNLLHIASRHARLVTAVFACRAVLCVRGLSLRKVTWRGCLGACIVRNCICWRFSITFSCTVLKRMCSLFVL